MSENVITSYKGFDNIVWKPIKGYLGLYEVSNTGLIKSIKRSNKTGRSYGERFLPEKILKQVTDKDGYKRVTLSKNGKRSNFYVHRLVATAFLDNDKCYPVVNHKNEDKTDNNVANLEWCTVKYNNHYGKGYCKKRFSKQRKEITALNLENKIFSVFGSINEASIMIGGNRNTIAKRIKTKSKKPYKGFLLKLMSNQPPLWD